MEDLQQKHDFLRNRFVTLLESLDEATPPRWGKMNVRQMVEHLSDYVRLANGRSTLPAVTPEERLPKMQDFLRSERPFPENTGNVLMPDTPPPFRLETKAEAIAELRGELNHFFEVFENQPDTAYPNPFFGLLDYELQIRLLYKHGTHHLRQFGIEV